MSTTLIPVIGVLAALFMLRVLYALYLDSRRGHFQRAGEGGYIVAGESELSNDSSHVYESEIPPLARTKTAKAPRTFR